ncbi:MAG: sigma-54-dependent transcriptional regulator [Candidatus Latescibacterota bacterium]
MRVLVVDDEEIVCVPLCDDLREAGYDVVGVFDAATALSKIETQFFDVMVSDVRMPGMDGLALMQAAHALHSEMVVIMITAFGTVENAVEAMKYGAYDYILKPFDTEKLLAVLGRIQEHQKLIQENRALKQQLTERHSFHQLIGKSAVMQKVYESLQIVCDGDATVLVSGKTGTGKEMIADAIHYNSLRKNGPLIKVSCATLSREVLESELFGHVRGAFTGAVQAHLGRFELADGGTIFLDEVDDIPLESQVKLLRVLENQEFERVGDERTRKIDVRVIAATKTDLRILVDRGTFRDDLFYRLNIMPIYLPTLSERREDIPLLINNFLSKLNRESVEFESEAMACLMTYDWPGNVRELRNVVERLILVRRGQNIRLVDLPPEIQHLEQVEKMGEGSFDEIVSAVEKRLLLRALKKTNGNKTKAAELLQMTPSTFRYKLSSLVDDD